MNKNISRILPIAMANIISVIGLHVVVHATEPQRSVKQVPSTQEIIERMARHVYRPDNVKYLHEFYNPNAKPEIIKIVMGQVNYPRSEVIISNFGLIADKHDVPLINSYFEDKKKIYDAGVVSAFAHTLSKMSVRGIKEADDSLDMLIQPEFWSERKLDATTVAFLEECDSRAEYAMLVYLAMPKMKSNDPAKAEKIAAALDKIPEPFQSKIASGTRIANYIYGVPRYAARAEHYVKVVQPEKDAQVKEFHRKQQEYIKNKQKENKTKRASQEALRVQKKKIGDMYTDRACYFMEEYPADVKTALITEADGFLNKTVKPWTRQPSDKKLRNSLLLSMTDDGFPLFHTINMHESEALDSWTARPKFVGELDDTREVAVDMLGRERDLAGAYVFTFAQGPIDKSRGEEIRKAPKSHAAVIIVAIPLKNAGDLKTKYPKFFAGASTGPFTTLDPNGNPLLHAVYLRDMNKWFWNPPGW